MSEPLMETENTKNSPFQCNCEYIYSKNTSPIAKRSSVCDICFERKINNGTLKTKRN